MALCACNMDYDQSENLYADVLSRSQVLATNSPTFMIG
jgi:hypothetical protein